MLEFSHITKSLWRNKLAPTMLVVQIAVSLAIISNALFFTADRIALMQRPTGVEDEGLFKLWARETPSGRDIEQTIQRDIELLSELPGVIDAAPFDSVPLSTFGSRYYLTNDLNSNADTRGSSATVYGTTDAGLNVLGTNLTAGRNFDATEIGYFEFELPESTVAIVSRGFAERIFSGESPLGEVVYLADTAVTIVGVVEQLMGTEAKDERSDSSVILPVIQKSEAINYLVKTSAADVDNAMMVAADNLRLADPNRVIGHEQTFKRIKAVAYADDLAMVYLLTTVVAVLIFVNALGIVGLTTLWVNQRKKQIGIRRALGATRGAIMRYFFVENVLLMGLATALGAGLAVAGAVYLAKEYSAQIMPWVYIPMTACALSAMALMAALAPTLRASRIAPAAAVANG